MSQAQTQNVSRETFTLLESYVALLQKWNPAINLIGKSTRDKVWERHIEDSLQLLPLIPPWVSTIADFGSGGGLPGMVMAIARPDIALTLIEQDQRKAAFLREVVGQLSLANVTIHASAIEKIEEKFALVTARALAPLSTLFALAYPRLLPGAICLFPKGQNFIKEREEARANWSFDCQVTHSKTQGESSIVSISELFPLPHQSRS